MCFISGFSGSSCLDNYVIMSIAAANNLLNEASCMMKLIAYFLGGCVLHSSKERAEGPASQRGYYG